MKRRSIFCQNCLSQMISRWYCQIIYMQEEMLKWIWSRYYTIRLAVFLNNSNECWNQLWMKVSAFLKEKHRSPLYHVKYPLFLSCRHEAWFQRSESKINLFVASKMEIKLKTIDNLHARLDMNFHSRTFHMKSLGQVPIGDSQCTRFLNHWH